MTGTCDRCHRKGKTFRIPWTGDHLCKDCIDQDSGLQQMFAEIDSMVYDQQLHDLGIPPTASICGVRNHETFDIGF